MVIKPQDFNFHNDQQERNLIYILWFSLLHTVLVVPVAQINYYIMIPVSLEGWKVQHRKAICYQLVEQVLMAEFLK